MRKDKPNSIVYRMATSFN